MARQIQAQILVNVQKDQLTAAMSTAAELEAIAQDLEAQLKAANKCIMELKAEIVELTPKKKGKK